MSDSWLASSSRSKIRDQVFAIGSFGKCLILKEALGKMGDVSQMWGKGARQADKDTSRAEDPPGFETARQDKTIGVSRNSIRRDQLDRASCG